MTIVAQYLREPVRPVVEDAALLACDLGLRRTGLVNSATAGLRPLEAHDVRLAASMDLLRTSRHDTPLEFVDRTVAEEPGAAFVRLLLALGSHDFEQADAILGSVPDRDLDGLSVLLWWLGDDVLETIANRRLVAAPAEGTRFYDAIGQVWFWCRRQRLLPGSQAKPWASGAGYVPPPWAGVTGDVDWLAALMDGVSRRMAQTRVRDALQCVLLGNRTEAVDMLEESISGVLAGDRFVVGCFLAAAALDRGRALLDSLPVEPRRIRPECIAGLLGDPRQLPWIIGRASEPGCARVAGEAFTMITGADLLLLQLDRPPPDGFEPGPNDDPNDPNVDMDEDDGLPWPDQEKIAAWWKANAQRFPAGQRFFMGKPPSMEHCLHVLKEGYQRQRMAAAIWRCILQPGTPLFPTDAPAWRQKRWLAQMTS